LPSRRPASHFLLEEDIIAAETIRKVNGADRVAGGCRAVWRPGAVVLASSPLRVDMCGMTDYIPAESWCVNATVTGLSARARLQARGDRLVRVVSGANESYTLCLDEVAGAPSTFARALALHDYASAFDFGVDVKVECELGALGLSSSSSVASLFNVALCLICNVPYDPMTIARQTQAVEPHWYGRQDQLAVAFGGINLWHMTPGVVKDGVAVAFGEVERFPIAIPACLTEELCNECFLIYDSGIEEGAAGVLECVAARYDSDQSLRATFSEMNDLAKSIHRILGRSRDDVEWLSELGEAFSAVRDAHERLHPSVTNQRMRDLFRAAALAGALGGRYSGAGGRGALTFICKPGEIARVTAALNNVCTPHAANGRTFTRGRRIHFGIFGDIRARAWFVG